MRNLPLLFALLVAIPAMSQTSSSYSVDEKIDYKITRQEPFKPFAVVNFDWLDLDMNLNNMGGSSFNFALRGYADPIEMAGIDYTLRRSWLTGLFKGSNTDFELGGHYMLFRSETEKETQIILRSSNSTDYSGARPVSVYSKTSIRIPAQRLIYRGVRGGLITKRGPYEVEDVEGVIAADATLSSTGIYAGISQRTFINTFISTESEYGNAGSSQGRDLSVDLLFYASNNFSIENIEGDGITADQIAERIEGGNLGFRVLYTIYQIEKKEYTGKTFGATKKFEAGYKPYQGFYFAVGYGWTIVKAREKLF